MSLAFQVFDWFFLQYGALFFSVFAAGISSTVATQVSSKLLLFSILLIIIAYVFSAVQLFGVSLFCFVIGIFAKMVGL